MERAQQLPPVVERFVRKAEASKPELHIIVQKPLGLVRAEKSDEALLGWKAVDDGKVEDQKVMKAGDSIIIDFGGHRTGHFSFDLVPYKFRREPNDSPCRLRLVFGEILNDVAEDLYPYDAWLSEAWLPDEIINVDFLPQAVHISRRHAFRFVKFQVIAVSRNYGVKVENPLAHAVSSAPTEDPPTLSFSKAGSTLSDDKKQMLRKIDTASLLTLRNCMQTVYEDGPRRDLRLWIGDLRLQALTNYETFGDLALAKRCLYLFAATPFNDEGLLPACCYEKPEILSGGNAIRDFSQIYAAALFDYVKASGDVETGLELLSVALKQFELSLRELDPKTALYIPNESDQMAEVDDPSKIWHFLDWQDELDKATASHCVIIFGLRALLALSQTLKVDTPTVKTPLRGEELAITEVIEVMVQSARKHLFDSELKTFISGPNKQISWAANAWAVMADVPESKAQAAQALTVAYTDDKSIIGVTPYLHHYLCEAFILAGLEDMAVQHILSYWGSMVTAGAETFWEAWDPKRPKFSPYGDLHSNSFCHAWSCTPSLLLRRLGYA